MTKEEILREYLEDKRLVEEGYLSAGEGVESKWSDLQHNKMAQVIKFAIEGVIHNESTTQLTRKINQYLDHDN